jgi:hypothetical protein
MEVKLYLVRLLNDLRLYVCFSANSGFIYICMYVCMYVCVCVCIYIYIYTHTHTQTHTRTYNSKDFDSLTGPLLCSNAC